MSQLYQNQKLHIRIILIDQCKKITTFNNCTNKYYDIQATVKYFHRTEHGATAVIQQDQVQRKIMLPEQSLGLDQRVLYRFSQFFYSKNGLINVNESGSTEEIKSQENLSLSLQEINQRKQILYNNYITTTLQLVDIVVPKIKQKNGTQLTLTLLKGFADNLVVYITLWNQQLSSEYIDKQLRLQEFRLKMLSKNTFVLVSTVDSKLTKVNQIVQPLSYNVQKHYRPLSEAYSQRNITEMSQTLKQLTKCFSIIQAKVFQSVKSVMKKSRAKLVSHAEFNQKSRTFGFANLSYTMLQEVAQSMFFGSELQGVLKLTKSGSVIKGKIRLTIKLDSIGDKNIESHTLMYTLICIKAITY